MNARRVHAVLAAGVQSPDLIERWQLDPRELQVHGIDEGTLDLSALWKFAGLTTKVRHNQLRPRFPLTFRLLHVTGMEIEVFASYASLQSSMGQRFASTTDQRAADLIAFLKDWLDPRRRSHSLLWDLVRHEEALASLGAILPATRDEGADASLPVPGTPDPASVPVLNGEIVLHEMRCDPREVAPVLFERVPRLDRLPLETRHWCYWRASGPHIRVLELDEFGYYALAFSDGMRSVAELGADLAGSPQPTPVFMSLLGELAAVGVLRFTPGPAAGAA